MIGVYAIHCLITGRRYIGSSTNVENRWSVHKSELKLNKHYSIELQEDYNKYGIEQFVYSVLEVCPKEVLKEREHFWMKTYRSTYYNKHPTPYGSKEYVFREETIKKMSDKAKARNAEPCYNRELSRRVKKQHAEGNFGKPTWTEESVRKKSESLKISINAFYETERGKELAKESSVRMTATQKELWKSEAYRARMKEVLSKNGSCQKPKIWITDGRLNKSVPPETLITEGWRRGMTKVYKEKQNETKDE